MIAKELGLPKKNYRVDLLRTLKPVNGSVENAEILVDIGANEGEFSNIFIDTFRPSSVICVEPNSSLNSDISGNTNNSKTIIINAAVGDMEGQADFYFHSDTQMSSLFSSDPEHIKRDFREDDPARTVRQTVEITTLDKIYSTYSAILEIGRASCRERV